MVYVSRKEMAEVDRLAVEEFNLMIKQMMENAGRNVARFIVDKLKPKKVVCLFGKGNNGGDALCCARHLKIYGVDVKIVGASEDGNEEVENQLQILGKMGIKNEREIGKCDVIVDGLLGYNINGNPRGRYVELIESVNDNGAKIVSYDLPSGMEPDSGKCGESCIKADYTMTLALPKKGLKGMKNLYLVNIGIPWELYGGLGIKVGNYFRKGDVVRVR